jgi:hypothetical protein
MTTILLVLLGIVGYIVIGVIVHMGLNKLLLSRGWGGYEIEFTSFLTSLFWIVGVPILLTILFVCSLVTFVYDLIEDITYKITGN